MPDRLRILWIRYSTVYRESPSRRRLLCSSSDSTKERGYLGASEKGPRRLPRPAATPARYRCRHRSRASVARVKKGQSLPWARKLAGDSKQMWLKWRPPPTMPLMRAAGPATDDQKSAFGSPIRCSIHFGMCRFISRSNCRVASARPGSLPEPTQSSAKPQFSI